MMSTGVHAADGAPSVRAQQHVGRLVQRRQSQTEHGLGSLELCPS